MFGYCDNDRCSFDLWSPVDDQCDGLDSIYSHGHSDSGMPHATENRAFSPYAKHRQELEDAVETILEQYRLGNYNFTLDFDDDISDEDVEWIEHEIERRLF